MKLLKLTFIVCFLFRTTGLYSQSVKLEKSRLKSVNVSMSIEKLSGKDVVKVVKDSTVKEVDEPTFIKLTGIDFKNGTIELKVLSRLLPNAPDYARGFIGIAFRINNNNTKFESIYIRPTNGKSDNQLRRNRSIQYFSYPDYKFERLRKEAPGEYESYADIGLNEWINLKIVVKDAQAKLFINDKNQPSLIINDLKHGANSSGGIGLWVDIGTEGFFSDVKVHNN